MFNIAAYEEARSVEEAIRLLQANPRARLIAGGTDLLMKIRGEKIAAAELISIHELEEIRGLKMEEDGTIIIGAGTSFSKISAHPLIKEHVPILADAVETIGGPQIRHMGTIGGNLCNGAVSADTAPALLVLNARLQIQGAAGRRISALRNFFRGPGQVELQHDEILTAVLLDPEDYRGFGGCYIKYSMRKAMDIGTLGCAVLCKVTDGLLVEDFRLAFSVAAPTPLRCPETERLVAGRSFSEELQEEVAQRAVAEVRPRSSWRASREFRLHLVAELSKRAFKQAFINAGGLLP